MKRTIIVMMLAMGVTACGRSVYDDPIPASNDTKAMTDIRNGLKQEDQDAWRSIASAMVFPDAPKIQSKTVSAAITAMKSRMACQSKHNFTNISLGQVDATNEFNAYTACDKIVV